MVFLLHFLIGVGLRIGEHQGVPGRGGLLLGAPDHPEKVLVRNIRQEQGQRLRSVCAQRPRALIRVVTQPVGDGLNVLLRLDVQPAGIVQRPRHRADRDFEVAGELANSDQCAAPFCERGSGGSPRRSARDDGSAPPDGSMP